MKKITNKDETYISYQDGTYFMYTNEYAHEMSEKIANGCQQWKLQQLYQ